MIEYKNREILNELAAIATARPSDCLRWEDGKLELREEIPEECAAAIASIERGPSGVKLRFHDKLKAMEMLLLHTGTLDRAGEGASLLEAIVSATKCAMLINETGEEKESENGVFIGERG